MCAAWAWLMGSGGAPEGKPEGAWTQVCTAIVWGPNPTALLTSPEAPGDLLGQPLLSSVGHHGSLAVPPDAGTLPTRALSAVLESRGRAAYWWPLRMRH